MSELISSIGIVAIVVYLVFRFNEFVMYLNANTTEIIIANILFAVVVFLVIILIFE